MLTFGLLFAAGLASWLLAGRWIVGLLDGVTLEVVDQREVERFRYEGGILQIEGKRLDLLDPAFAAVASVSLESNGSAAVLESGGKRFRLGTASSISSEGGALSFECAKDPGDQVQFTHHRSRLPWLTPFEMNFMTGYSPSRKRNVYFRLRWRKPGGEQLEMVWETGQSYYSRDGWLPREMESVTDSLMRVAIQAAR